MLLNNEIIDEKKRKKKKGIKQARLNEGRDGMLNWFETKTKENHDKFPINRPRHSADSVIDCDIIADSGATVGPFSVYISPMLPRGIQPSLPIIRDDI